MKMSGVSDGTTADYRHAVRRYLAFLGESLFPIRRAFLNFDVPPGMLRLTGFALRRLTRYWREVDGMDIDLGVPSRLTNPSRPNPSPLRRQEILLMLRTARRIYPPYGKKAAIGRTFRCWLLLTLEWGARISETELTWGQIGLEKGSVLLCGKMGES